MAGSNLKFDFDAALERKAAQRRGYVNLTFAERMRLVSKLRRRSRSLANHKPK